MAECNLDETTMKDLLAQKTAEYTNVKWDLERARLVFGGYCSPMPFDVWREAGLFLVRNDKSVLGGYARKILKVDCGGAVPLRIIN